MLRNLRVLASSAYSGRHESAIHSAWNLKRVSAPTRQDKTGELAARIEFDVLRRRAKLCYGQRPIFLAVKCAAKMCERLADT